MAQGANGAWLALGVAGAVAAAGVAMGGRGSMAKRQKQGIPVPFGGNYHRNSMIAEDKGLMPCCICGKGTKPGTARRWLRVIRGGSEFALPNAPDDGSGEMGFYPVGPECRKTLPAAFWTVTDADLKMQG